MSNEEIIQIADFMHVYTSLLVIKMFNCFFNKDKSIAIGSLTNSISEY